VKSPFIMAQHWTPYRRIYWPVAGHATVPCKHGTVACPWHDLVKWPWL